MTMPMQYAQREDDGLFAAGSIVRRVWGHPGAIAYGFYREALMAAVGPVSAHAINTQSLYKSDPFGRIRRTSTYATAVIFGTTAQAERASALVRGRHARIGGVEPVTGETYSLKAPFTGAERDRDRRLMVAGYVIIMESVPIAYDMFCRRLTDDEWDRYWQEIAPVGVLLGIEAEHLPTSTEAVNDFHRGMIPELALTYDGKQLYQHLVDATQYDRRLLPVLPAHTLFAAQTLTTIPDGYRDLMPAPVPKRLDPLLIASARATARTMALAPSRRGIERLMQTEDSRQILAAERASRRHGSSRPTTDAVSLAS